MNYLFSYSTSILVIVVFLFSTAQCFPADHNEDASNRFPADLLKLLSRPELETVIQDVAVSGSSTTPTIAVTLSFSGKDHIFAGTIEFTVDSWSAEAQPRLTGTGMVRDGYYKNRSFGTILQDIEGILIGQGDRIVLCDFTAVESEGGTIHGAGYIDLSGRQEFSFTASFELTDATVYRSPHFQITVDGTVSVTGNPHQALVSGSLFVPSARIRVPPPLPLQGKPLEVEIEGYSSEKVVSTPPKNFSDFSVITDVMLSNDHGILIEGRGLESEWEGAIRFFGPLTAQQIDAQLKLLHGSFYFFEEPLVLTEAILFFNGPVTTLPEALRLTVMAEKKRRDLTAYLHLAGSLSSAELFIESSPAYAYNQILSQVLFNRLIATITPAQAILLSRARSMLDAPTMTVLEFMDRASRPLQVERLDLLQSEARPREIDPTTRAYLREDVYVEVEEGPGGQPGEVTVEIELTPNIYLETEADGDVEGGIGLLYKWRY